MLHKKPYHIYEKTTFNLSADNRKLCFINSFNIQRPLQQMRARFHFRRAVKLKISRGNGTTAFLFHLLMLWIFKNMFEMLKSRAWNQKTSSAFFVNVF